MGKPRTTGRQARRSLVEMKMGKEPTAKTGLVPPPDDGSIDRALGEVDAKLAAWSSAMQSAHERLRAPRPVGLVDPPADALPIEPPPDVAPAVEPEPVAEPEPALSTPVIRAAVDSSAAESDVAPPPAEPDEDATLLASLNEETAAAIRVMRRLAPEGTSVRELLEQHRKTKSVPLPVPIKKKSWFSRGR